MPFPTLVGGTLVRADLAPSIVFAILFGSLVPLAAFRLLRKSSRTFLLIGTISFVIERVVIFSLRAVQSRNQAKAGSHGLATYEQLTIGMGYISICQDLVYFLRVLLVKATKPLEQEGSQKPDTDRPRERFWCRRLADFLNLAFISAIVPGIISGSHYSAAINNPGTATRVMTLRYASTGVALFLTATVGIIACVAPYREERIKKRPAYILVCLSALLSTVAIYRLAVMHNNIDSLFSRTPGSLSSPSAKALFYIFHMLPEWLASAVLLGLNVREVFNTGPFGDWRGSDAETKWDRKKREKRERAKAEGAHGGEEKAVGRSAV